MRLILNKFKILRPKKRKLKLKKNNQLFWKKHGLPSHCQSINDKSLLNKSTFKRKFRKSYFGNSEKVKLISKHLT